jgi:3' exoribonuclease, RNase T-like
MNYFLDTEFLEGSQKTFFGKTKPTIDLISIGIVCENGNNYYAISKDFNLKEAWNRYEFNEEWLDGKYYWIRHNILKEIFNEWKSNMNAQIVTIGIPVPLNQLDFTYNNFKYCIKQIGKSNNEIATQIKRFVQQNEIASFDIKNPQQFKPNFYGYYADYDWVVFCWLFGKMVDLPVGFPMYCKDLKQMMCNILNNSSLGNSPELFAYKNNIDKHPDYPKQTNEHNALSDAKWNYKLFKFLRNVS